MNVNKKLLVENVCSKDKNRAILAQPWLDVEGARMLACDGFVLAVVPVELDPADTTGPVPVDALKLARKNRGGDDFTHEIVASNGTASVEVGGQSSTFNRLAPGQVDRYPDVDQVVNDATKHLEADTEATITIDAQKLYDLAKAICVPGGAYGSKMLAVKLYIDTPRRAVYVKPNKNGTDNSAYGVIMPVQSR